MYHVEVCRRAEKQIDRLPPAIRQKVLQTLKSLADVPRPPGTKKMKGYDRRYRVRIRDYRVVYDIYDDRLIVEVIEAGHRREIYR